MSFIQIDPLGWIPDRTKQQIIDSIVTFVAEQAEKVRGKRVSRTLRKLRSDAAFQKAVDQGLKEATERFVREYMIEDEDLVAAITHDSDFWKHESVRQALLEIIKHPGILLAEEQLTVARSFVDVLQQRVNRDRVDRAVTFYLRCVAEALWHLEPIRPIYELQMQRMSVDRATEMVQELRGVRADVRQAMAALVQAIGEQQKALPGPTELMLPEPKRVCHNLPQPDYGVFIGREEELAQVHQLLAPASRHFLVTIDGIGGIGKSALALEVAHRYLRDYHRLLPEERFDAIIWASAKSSVLTAEGITSRPQVARTLSDIYTTIAVTLEQADITRARPEEQDELITRALTRQRTLLIVDNLETVDDERVNAFLRQLPAPTKAIVTTRHRIDAAYPVRLAEMPQDDGLALIAQECERKGVELALSSAERLYKRTGGVPLAIVWSVAQMGAGYGIRAVLRRLGAPTSDVTRFCFEGSVRLIRDKPAHKLLMALTLFVPSGSREALGYVADLPELDRDDGLVELEKLSLVNKQADRFVLLPLTKVFASAELDEHQDFRETATRRWVAYLKELYPVAESEYYWRYRSYVFLDEGANILEAIEWSYDQGTAEDVFLLSQAANDYLDQLGDWKGIVSLCGRALSLARTVRNPIATARFAMMVGWIYRQWGEYDEATPYFLEALEQYREIGNLEGESIALHHLGSIHRKREEFDRAAELIEQAWKIAEDLGIGDLQALIRTDQGKLARSLGDWETAWEHFVAVRNWFEEHTEQVPRDEVLARSIWGHIASVEYYLGRPQEAKELCLKSLDFFEERGTKGFLATLKYRLALAEEALGDLEAARQHAKEAVDWFDRLGMKPDLAEAQPLLERLEQANR
jgi:tetratricopeptide (TPR) repeat protein